MKHYKMILATLFVALIAFSSLTAQQEKSQSQPKTTEHLKFMGIPIDGSPKSFANQLKSKGFTFNSSSTPDIIWMTGTFAGISDSNVLIYKSPSSANVYKVRVVFPGQDSWTQIEIRYNRFKDWLSQKYLLTESKEEFQGYSPERDSSKMTKLILGDCSYWSVYGAGTPDGTFLGSVSLDLMSISGENKGYVRIEYEDYLNGENAEQGIIDDL
ncbi:hypothetical protein [uncultured Porphyromonas sp.]|uniref:hypothetical protein n=1 Tax=uncultured Porphyromonas sp. TaxID=159274 RepID=UPI002804D761|nr:hypothetical protein [uncultured Porphyromonas sp.]